MCNTCLVKLINSNSFIQKCQESDTILHSVLNTQGLCHKKERKFKNENSEILQIHVESEDNELHDEKQLEVYDNSQSSDEENKPGDNFDHSSSDDSDINTNKEVVKLKKDSSLKGIRKGLCFSGNKIEFACYGCKESFKTRQELRYHQKEVKHPKPRNFICTYCPKAFPTRDHLSRHLRTHTKERPYKCGICDVSFSMVQNLRRHEKLHTGERPHVCNTCGKGKSKLSF